MFALSASVFHSVSENFKCVNYASIVEMITVSTNLLVLISSHFHCWNCYNNKKKTIEVQIVFEKKEYIKYILIKISKRSICYENLMAA